jgi:hypothetical protein
MTGLLVINVLERMWKEMVRAYFEVFSMHLSRGSMENHEIFQAGQSDCREDLGSGSPKYKGGVLTTQPQCLVTSSYAGEI